MINTDIFSDLLKIAQMIAIYKKMTTQFTNHKPFFLFYTHTILKYLQKIHIRTVVSIL